MTYRLLDRRDAENGIGSNEIARRSLHKGAETARAVIGQETVTVTVEPMIRRTEQGLAQSVRIAGPAPLISTAAIVDAAGVRIDIARENVPGGVRLFVPEVHKSSEVCARIEGAADIPFTLTPQRHWSIHLIHHSHLDIGYTDPQAIVLDQHMAFLDSTLELADVTEGWDDDAQFRWCVEALWPIKRWLASRPKAVADRFARRVRDGHIELTAMPFNMHTETCSTAELHEMLRTAQSLRSELDVPITAAMQTDVPGCVQGMVDALAQNGVKYLSVAHNYAGRSVPNLVGGDKLPRLFRWRAPSGESVLVWLTDSPHGFAYMEGPMLGFHESLDVVEGLLPDYLTCLATQPYPYAEGVFGFVPGGDTDRTPYPWELLHLRVQGMFGDNAPPRLIMSEIVREWNSRWAYPHLRLSTNADFFADAEKTLGDQIVTFNGDWNDWWAEGVGSAAFAMAVDRTAQADLGDAQTIDALNRLGGGAGGLSPELVDSAYESLGLFDEHTWGAGNPWGDSDRSFDSGDVQWHWKYACALRAKDLSHEALDAAGTALGGRFAAADGVLASFLIVNPAGRTRTDVCRFYLPASAVPLEDEIRVVDSRDGSELAFTTESQTNPVHRDRGRFIHVLVPEVPGLGAVRVDVFGAKGKPTPGSQVTASEPLVLETDSVRVELDLADAAIRSIVERATGTEIVNTGSAIGFGGYIYDRYTTAGGFNHQSSKTVDDGRLNHLGSRQWAENAVLISRESTPLAELATFQVAAPGTRSMRVTVTVYRHEPRIDLTYRIAKTATMDKESAYIAFPFAVNDPSIRVEVTGGQTGTDLPTVPGSAEHMRAMRRWIEFNGGPLPIGWAGADVPLVEIGEIALPYAPFPPTLPESEPATVFSWVHNNLWDTNFPSQQGFEMDLRYSIVLGGDRPGPRAAEPFATPLRGVRLTGSDPVELLGSVEVDDPAVQTSLTPARDGRVLVRLRSLSDQPVTATVRIPAGVGSYQSGNYLGIPTGDVITGSVDRVEVTIPPMGVTGLLLAK